MTRPLPHLIPDRCTHARLDDASCQACEDVCPTDAIFPAGPDLVILADGCVSCAACVAACPEGALQMAPEGPPVLSPVPALPGVALAICDRHPAAAGEREVAACIHGLSLADLAAARAGGTVRIALATGDCAACPRRPAVTLGDRLAQLAALAEPRGAATLALIPATRAMIAVTLRERAGVDPARRAIFRRAAELAAPEAPDPDAAWAALISIPGPLPHAPRIDSEACTGCDACLRICPHEVLGLTETPETGLCYDTRPTGCTGCGLCADICEVNAVQILTLTETPPPVPLTAFRCRACGVAVHEPAAAHTDDLCRICRKTGHHARLYQVLQ